MKCDILDCCHFILEHMDNFPKTAEYLKSKLCHGDYEKCPRHRIYLGFDSEDVPFDLDLNDAENMQRIRLCLEKKLNV